MNVFATEKKTNKIALNQFYFFHLRHHDVFQIKLRQSFRVIRSKVRPNHQC